MKIGQIRKVIDVSADDINEILVGAFEGGSNYWARKVEVVDDDYKGGEYASDVIGLGGKLIIHTIDGLEFMLTQAMMLDGIQRYVDDGGKHYPFTDGNPDAYTYDTILQNALFKEVVYG
mgnify:CR=1 FL=1|tara:strand:- start:1179 stop:1535 length:357 start_codon:yes stop_codon:yes gene_type:complete